MDRRGFTLSSLAMAGGYRPGSLCLWRRRRRSRSDCSPSMARSLASSPRSSARTHYWTAPLPPDRLDAGSRARPCQYQHPRWGRRRMGRYDPQDDRWFRASPLPCPGNHIPVAADAGRFYAPGGFKGPNGGAVTGSGPLGPYRALAVCRSCRGRHCPERPDPFGGWCRLTPQRADQRSLA